MASSALTKTRVSGTLVPRPYRPRPPLSEAILDLKVAVSHDTATRLDEACRLLNAQSKTAPLWTTTRVAEVLIKSGLDDMLPKLLTQNQA